MASGTVIPVSDGGGNLSIDDGGNTITVDGTVTANLGATDNAVLDAIQVATEATQAAVEGTVAVSAASLPLPTGAATESSLSALAGDVGDTADAAATAGSTGTLHAKQRLMTSQLDSIKTAVETLDNAISGSEMQVDVVAALPAGDNVVGRVKLSDGTDVADVLDLTNSNPLTVAIVDGDGTQITSFGGGTQYTEDAAAAANPVGTALNLIRADALAGVTSTDGDNVAARGTDKGELYVKHADSIAVTHTALTELAAAIDTELQVDVVGALPAGTNNIGDVDILSIAAGDNNIGNVDIASIAAGDNNIGNVDIVSLPASTNTIEVVGDAAHDAATAGNPVLVAGSAQNMDDTAPPNRVSAESDATRLATDWDGAIFAHPHGPQVWSKHLDGSTAYTDESVHAAPGAGLSLYVTDIVVSTGAATAMNIFFEESTTKVLGPWYLEAVAGRGLHIKFATPKKITANTALTVTTSASIAQSIDVTGFTAPG